MIRKVLHGYELAEARGHIPAGTAVKATFATILEAGTVAFQKSYFGNTEWNKTDSDVKANRETYEAAASLQESLLMDVSRVRGMLREAQTSTDFPLILANLRSRVMRESFNPVQSKLWEMAEKRTASDFKIMKGYRVNTMDELALRPEGEDVEMTKIDMTDDGYAVASYEKGIYFTWEMWKNDDLGAFTIGLKNLGLAARRTRAKVALRAIQNGVTQYTPPVAGVGGPTIVRLQEVVQSLAEQTNDDGEAMDIGITDIAFGAQWLTTVNETLKSPFVLGPTTAKTGNVNVVQGIATPHEERIIARVLGADWLAWDNNYPFLEVATLEGFEGGPQTYTQMPDVVEHPDQGSFSNHTIGVKAGDAVGSKVTQTKSVRRVKGS